MPFTTYDLKLLDGYLSELARTPYFSLQLNEYLVQLRATTSALKEKYDSIPQPVRRSITRQVWAATKYLSGSISKEIPYEVVYALHLALNDWGSQLKRPYAITTALVHEQDYHFLSISTDFYTLVQAYLGIKFNSDLIQVAMPRLYRHTPLHMTALYHELGHFVESHHEVVKLSLLHFPPLQNAGIPPQVSLPLRDKNDLIYLYRIHASHRREYFSDLFAATYAGKAYSNFLGKLADGHAASPTHPSTADRLQNITDYLSGHSTKLIEMFQAVLKSIGMPAFHARYSPPNLENSFNNIRPYRIASDVELHGMLEAGSNLLHNALQKVDPPWSNFDKDDIPKIVNDLIEKSMRNRMIEERWGNGAA